MNTVLLAFLRYLARGKKKKKVVVPRKTYYTFQEMLTIICDLYYAIRYNEGIFSKIQVMKMPWEGHMSY